MVVFDGCSPVEREADQGEENGQHTWKGGDVFDDSDIWMESSSHQVSKLVQSSNSSNHAFIYRTPPYEQHRLFAVQRSPRQPHSPHLNSNHHPLKQCLGRNPTTTVTRRSYYQHPKSSISISELQCSVSASCLVPWSALSFPPPPPCQVVNPPMRKIYRHGLSGWGSLAGW
jgi:hypothetical protein